MASFAHPCLHQASPSCLALVINRLESRFNQGEHWSKPGTLVYTHTYRHAYSHSHQHSQAQSVHHVSASSLFPLLSLFHTHKHNAQPHTYRVSCSCHLIRHCTGFLDTYWTRTITTDAVLCTMSNKATTLLCVSSYIFTEVLLNCCLEVLKYCRLLMPPRLVCACQRTVGDHLTVLMYIQYPISPPWFLSGL